MNRPPPGDPQRDPPVVQHARLHDSTLGGVALLADALGYRLFVVDLAQCLDKACLLERSARALAFPDWFGNNWDAWFDCLADLSWHPPAAGYVIALRNARGLAQAAPEALDTALAILGDAARVWSDRGITLRVFVDTAGND